MADEGRESVRKLNSEIAEYQSRLQASERLVLADSLTGMFNRVGFEQELAQRVHRREKFSLLVADLNGFKAINDNYGHLVGDEILKRFAGEFKALFFAADTVARWGGDEFVGIVAGGMSEGLARARNVRHRALGKYKVAVAGETLTVRIDASLGVAEWNGAETGQELFARTDKDMYLAKQHSR